jgi:hypothetical protein
MIRRLVLLVVAWGSTSFACAAEPNVPLNIEFPQEVLAGTPPDVLALLYPDLEMPKPDDQAQLLVPKGTTNVALHKPVSSSDDRPLLGELSFVTDGHKEGSESAFVELAPGKQWVQIDLQKPCEIYAICVWHFFREARSYNDVVIQVADDAEFQQGVKTLYSNDQDNSLSLGLGKARPYIETNLGKIIDAKGARARYVRLYSKGYTGNQTNHYVEVEVFGKPTP